jgi:hypothetical protein
MSARDMPIAQAESLARQFERKRKWRMANKAKISIYNRRYRDAHPPPPPSPERRRYKAKAAKAWRKRTRKVRQELERARLREYYRANREAILAKKRLRDAEIRALRDNGPEALAERREKYREYAGRPRRMPAWLAGQVPLVKVAKTRVHVLDREEEAA